MGCEMWYVYKIINKAQNYQYIGLTKNIRKRLELHNKGYTQSTKPYRPFDQIIVIDQSLFRKDARNKEKYYKSGSGRELLKKRGVV